MSNIKIKSAIISVFNKDGLAPIVKELGNQGVTIYSTGGTQTFIEEQGVKVERVEDLTSYPSILGGRVKTLHPKVFGGILNRNDNEQDQAQLAEFEIPSFDLVIVDLYPFEETVAAGGSHEDIIEKIDIGGISLIRAAAKNYKDVALVSNRNQYADFLTILTEQNGETSIAQRKDLAADAFNVSSNYDTHIFNYFNADEKPVFKQSITEAQILRYGENPHQEVIYYGDLDAIFDKLHGKELSYNNLLDVDAAVCLIEEFKNDKPTFAILKHNNACGIATRDTIKQAYVDALAGDPVSAFGGILIANTKIDAETEADFTVVTTLAPTEQERADLVFANKLVKHTKSNTIVLAKNGQLLASGTGQTSRVDALNQAIHKAKSFNFDLKGAVMASDAFFPFPDCVEIANLEGINTVVQPGGSIKDQLSIDYCEANKMAMVFTGNRHFKH